MANIIGFQSFGNKNERTEIMQKVQINIQTNKLKNGHQADYIETIELLTNLKAITVPSIHDLGAALMRR